MVRDQKPRSRSTAPPSVLPDISPTGGEIGRHLGFRQSPTLKRSGTAKLPISPQVGEMSGRTEGGAVEHRGPATSPPSPSAGKAPPAPPAASSRRG
nr:hypothetical protein [Mesorhizobium sp.]